ncbi:MAG TPA: DUF6789 family protein [Steroidobacteraceae bacterium]|nr:DUF6789 family protein [Steroidobacteraceae bacterium]
MTDLVKGIAAGLIATAVSSAILVGQRALGLVPSLDIVGIWSTVLGAPGQRAGGLIAHLTVSAVAGGALFAWLEPRLGADGTPRRGVLFGVLAWLASMALLMPASHSGMFGLRLGALAPIVMLLASVAYGAVLGWLYSVMMPTPPLGTRDPHRAT